MSRKIFPASMGKLSPKITGDVLAQYAGNIRYNDSYIILIIDPDITYTHLVLIRRNKFNG